MRKNSRFSWMAVALCLPFQGCVAHGSGFRELAWASGWQPLPIGRWLLNEGIQPKTLVICPAELCTHMSVVALFEASGRDAASLERSLGNNALLSERKNRPAPRTIGGKPAKKNDVTATTQIERFMIDGMAATRVALTPSAPSMAKQVSPRMAGNSAYIVVLTQRSGPTLRAVMAVTTDPEMALAQARAAAKDW